MSIMDNAKGDDVQPATSPYSRGLIVEMEHNNRALRARASREYRHPHESISNKRGNVQMLPNGNVFLGWDSAGLISEHTADDKILLEAHWLKQSRFASYRAFKFNWIGHPEEPPDVRAIAYGNASDALTVIYASWNGATEHRSWQFHTAEGDVLGRAARTGFETIFSTKLAGSRVYAQAFDAKDNVLGTSEVVHVDHAQSMMYLPSIQSSTAGSLESVAKFHPLLTGLISILSILGFLFLVRNMLLIIAPWSRRRYQRVPTSET